MERTGFTLVEMLVVVAIIMVLLGLLFPAFSSVREAARKTKAKNDVKQLDMAFKGVLSDYRTWDFSGIKEQLNGIPMSGQLVSYLAGSGSTPNTKGIAYMEFDGSSLNSDGAMVDPWYSTKKPNNFYYVALGAMGAVTPPHGPIARSVAAWSRGPDGLDATTDDIKSWE